MKTFSTFLLVGFAGIGLGAGARLQASHETKPIAAPSLVGDAWVNVTKESLPRVQSFKGRVTLLHFWTFACINCKHNLPHYAKWAATYDPKDVQVVGVHSPELDFEKKDENVRQAIKDLGITYPVLIDKNMSNWKRYEQRYWPTVYLIDKQGRVRFSWEGELEWQGAGGVAQVTQMIERLRNEK